MKGGPGHRYHPGTKVLAVLLLALGVIAHGRALGLVLTAGVVLAGMARVPGALGTFLGLVRRLRWVFLFIAILHGWFTPGEPVLDLLGGASPAREGLVRAGELIGVVAVMAGLVGVLVRSTPGMELAMGLSWMLSPLGALGVPVERFGRLLAWTLDRVGPVQREAGAVRDALKLRWGAGRGVGGRIGREVAVARMVLRRAREAADRNAEGLYLRGAARTPSAGAPELSDWLPVAGAAVWLGLLLAL